MGTKVEEARERLERLINGEYHVTSKWKDWITAVDAFAAAVREEALQAIGKAASEFMDTHPAPAAESATRDVWVSNVDAEEAIEEVIDGEACGSEKIATDRKGDGEHIYRVTIRAERVP
jgi:hypothetical protein